MPKFDFNTINKNYIRSIEVAGMFPQIQQYLDRKLEWDVILDMELQVPTNLVGEFNYTEERLDLILGRKTIDFDTLKDMMVDSVYKCLYQGMERSKSDVYDNCEEMKELGEAVVLIENLTKVEFEMCFNDIDKWDAIFPHLYRLEVMVFWDLTDEIVNYAIYNGLEVCESVIDQSDGFEYYMEEYVSEKSINKMYRKIKENEETDKLLSDIINVIYSPKSPHVNPDLLKKKLMKELSNNFDKQRFKRNSKLNSLIED